MPLLPSCAPEGGKERLITETEIRLVAGSLSSGTLLVAERDVEGDTWNMGYASPGVPTRQALGMEGLPLGVSPHRSNKQAGSWPFGVGQL